MKTKSKTNLSPNLHGLLIGLLLLSASCKKEEAAPSSEILFSNIAITGAQEAPDPVTTNASGTFNGSFDKDTKILTYTITYSNITPTAMHFHKGAAGVAGPVVVPISVSASPISASTQVLTAEQETDLLAGNWYVNIHSQAYPGGEIRGQLIPSN